MSNCSCVSTCVDEDYAADIYNSKIVTARKEHKCGECSKTISPKEEYEVVNILRDGTFRMYKTCTDCVSIRNVFFCNGWIFKNIMDDIRKHIDYCGGEISSDSIVKLTPYARDKVCDMIEMTWK